MKGWTFSPSDWNFSLNGWQFPLGVGNTELWGKRFGLVISQLASRVRGRGGSETHASHRVKLPGSGRKVAFYLPLHHYRWEVLNWSFIIRMWHCPFTSSAIIILWRIVFCIMYHYYYYMCLINNDASEAVNLCVVGPWRNPPNIQNKNVPNILEKKISVLVWQSCVQVLFDLYSTIKNNPMRFF